MGTNWSCFDNRTLGDVLKVVGLVQHGSNVQKFNFYQFYKQII